MRTSGDRLNIFVSHSPEAARLKDDLLEHLTALERFHLVEIWTADLIPVGANRATEVERALERADIALLLLNASWLAALGKDKALSTSLERRAANGLLIVPIILHHCSWEAQPLFNGLQALPRNGEPIAGSAGNKRAKALKDVVVEIAGLTEQHARTEHKTPISPQAIKRRSWATPGLVALPAMFIVASLLVWYTGRRKSDAGNLGDPRSISLSEYDYRGVIQNASTRQPIAEVQVILLGTSCTAKTDESGFFSLSGCDPLSISRLRNPQVNLVLPDGSKGCSEIQLLRPPDVTGIKIDPAYCQADSSAPLANDQLSPVSPAASAPKPPAVAPSSSPINQHQSTPPQVAAKPAPIPSESLANSDMKTVSIPEMPPQGAVTAAVGAVIGGARACVAGADDVSRAQITFRSNGSVKNVSVTGWAASHGATGCIKAALQGATVGPFSSPTFSVDVTIRP